MTGAAATKAKIARRTTREPYLPDENVIFHRRPEFRGRHAGAVGSSESV